MCLVLDQFFIIRTILCATVKPWSYNNNLFVNYTSLHFCSRKHEQLSLQWRSSNHDFFLHTQLDFTQSWLNSYYLLPSLSCLFKCASNQSDEGSWSVTLGVSPSREFYCDYIVVCVLCTQCLLLRSHTCLSLFLSYLLLLVYLEQVGCIC